MSLMKDLSLVKHGGWRNVVIELDSMAVVKVLGTAAREPKLAASSSYRLRSELQLCLGSVFNVTGALILHFYFGNSFPVKLRRQKLRQMGHQARPPALTLPLGNGLPPFDTAGNRFFSKLSALAERYQDSSIRRLPLSLLGSPNSLFPEIGIVSDDRFLFCLSQIQFSFVPKDELKTGIPSLQFFRASPSYLISIIGEKFKNSSVLVGSVWQAYHTYPEQKELAAKDHIRSPSAGSCTVPSPSSRSNPELNIGEMLETDQSKKTEAISTKADSVKSHGHNVLKISELFAKVCSILKVDPKAPEAIEHRSNASSSRMLCKYFACLSDNEEDVRVRAKAVKELAVKMWSSCGGSRVGFPLDSSLGALDSCSLKEMVSEGIRAASYDAYVKVCKLGLWKANLADSLELALEEESECFQKLTLQRIFSDTLE
nr:poly(A)-specific ribonuclease PARN-like [Ipomoea batatas]